MSFDGIHNALNSFQSCSFLSTYPHNLLFSLFPQSRQVQLVLPIYSWMCGLPLKHGQVASSDALQENGLSIFPRHYQLPVAPWVGLRFRVFLLFPCLDFVSPDLELCCDCYSNYYEFICVVAFLCPENTISL